MTDTPRERHDGDEVFRSDRTESVGDTAPPRQDVTAPPAGADFSKLVQQRLQTGEAVHKPEAAREPKAPSAVEAVADPAPTPDPHHTSNHPDLSRADAAHHGGHPATDGRDVGNRRRQPWDILVDIIVAPAGAFRYLAEQRHVSLSLLVAYVVTVIGMTTEGTASVVDDPVEPGPVLWLISTLFGVTMVLLIAAGFQHFVVRLLGGKNRFVYTLQAVSFTTLPNVLLAPLYVVHRMVDLGSFMVLANRGVYLWSLVLLVIAMREVHKISTGRAVAAVAIPLVIGVVLAFVLTFWVLGALLI